MAATSEPYPFIYNDGVKISIIAHKPPPPFGHRFYKPNQPSTFPPQPTHSEGQLDYVFRHHPIKTEPVKHPHENIMTIVKQLTHGSSEGARVFICKLSPKVKGQKDDLVFAKIYDPLYYSYAFQGIESVRNPVVTCADMDYSREAAAYETMRDFGHDGGSAPAYYGSWTFTAPPYHGRARPVRLIITEYIAAASMHQEYYHAYAPNTHPKRWIPPNERPDLSDGFRLRILAHALDLKSRQLHFGLDQNDLAPRNIIVLFEDRQENSLEKRPIKRVVLVDYNESIVYQRSNQKFQQTERPPNPIETYWRHGIKNFEAWIPKKWHESADHRREWLYKTFGQSQRYEPLSQAAKNEVEAFLKSNKKSHVA